MDHTERDERQYDAASQEDVDNALDRAGFDARDENEADCSLAARHPNVGEPFAAVVARRLSRRSFLQATAATAATAAVTAVAPTALMPATARADMHGNLTYTPIEGNTLDKVTVPQDYDWNVIIRWGDSIDPRTPSLTQADILNGELVKPGAAENQAKQFGYNCDLNIWFPYSYKTVNPSSRRGLMCVNHEYVNPELMFINWPADETDDNIRDYVTLFPEAVRVMQEAHGLSVIEIKRRGDEWEYYERSRLNRRITATTPIEITGPLRGHPLMQTSADPTGTVVLGMLNNCAGGKTPWGTCLTCEENVDRYFGNYAEYLAGSPDPQIVSVYDRLPPRGGLDDWGWLAVDPRFDVAQEPNEFARFGYVVEVDPYDPDKPAKKRTALGRFKHEGATFRIADSSGQVVIYSGDDARFEYVYKFVTAGTYDPENREANMDLLDEGTLYVGRFNEDGSGDWIPLVYGQNGLDESNGFTSQADVVIRARAAGDVVGATPMDRPEDVEPNPVTGKVYVNLTNNSRRDPDETDEPNPRGPNTHGHIVEITEQFNDAAATSFTWEIFILCGDPLSDTGQLLTSQDQITASLPTDDTYFAGFSDAGLLAPLGAPDNMAFDIYGNMWVATDGNSFANDGVFPVPTFGPNRGKLQQFLSGPKGCEICGPEFNTDNTAFFCNIQHPGAGGSLSDGVVVSTWPDEEVPARPSLIAVYHNGQKVVGS